MTLSRIGAENFRLFERFELAPGPHLNLILGPNASGKTTVLEAIHALGRGNSFRGTAAEAAGKAGAHWAVHGRLGGAAEHVIGVGWSADGLELRLDRADIALPDLIRRFPVQVLEPDSHRLLQDGPAYRRRFLDWGVFHVEHQFHAAWRRYHRALRQRNRALKSGAGRSEVEAWNPELVASGEAVHALRLAHLEPLRERLGDEIAGLLGEAGAWALDLAPGWTAGATLAEALVAHYDQDRRQGQTLAGPHRAELRLRLEGRSARRQVSRGQQKLLVAALLLAQARRVAEHTGVAPALLVDDFPAELGGPFQVALIARLDRYPGQVFLTAIEATEALRSAPEMAVFHVEHGTVKGASLV